MQHSHRKYLSGTAVAIALALPTAVFAGGKMAPMEPVVVAPAPAPMTEPMTWTGFYGGLGIGYGRGASNTGISATEGNDLFSFNPSVSGFIGSARLGYDVQRGNFVFGGLVEGSLGKISGSSGFTVTSDDTDNETFVRDASSSTLLPGCGPSDKTPKKCEDNGNGVNGGEVDGNAFTASASYSNLMSVALRAGTLVNDNNTLLYGRLGVSRAKLTVGLPLGGSMSSTATGFNAGLGVEHLLNQNISVFAEYNYHDVGKSFTATVDNADWTVKGKGLHTVNMGLNFRF